MSPCIEIRSKGNTSRISDLLHHMAFLANITETDWVTSSFPLREAGSFASRRKSGFAKTSWSTAALYCYPEHLNFHAFPQIMQPGAYMRFLFGTVWWGCRSVFMIDVCIYADVVQNIVLWTQLQHFVFYTFEPWPWKRTLALSRFHISAHVQTHHTYM